MKKVFFNSEEIQKLFKAYARSKNKYLRECLILEFGDFVKHLAHKYATNQEGLENLVSVGNIALMKAIERFDSERNVKFETYATIVILGEMKHYFRDQTWGVKVPRGEKTLYLKVKDKLKKASSEILDGKRVLQEIAEELKLSEAEVLAVIEIGMQYQPVSLSTKCKSSEDENLTLETVIPQEDVHLENAIQKIDLEKFISLLTETEQKVIDLFYFKDYSQQEIAKTVGISQAQISRILDRANEKIKKIIGTHNE